MLDKTFRLADVEGKHYASWQASGAFACGRRSDAQPYTIVIPPPNVTGSLHMGHALNNTLQDVLVRYQRMRGRDVLWQPGMDHAGIATQMVVEQKLQAQGVTLDRGGPTVGANTAVIGRAAFLEKVWEWKEQSGGTILGQLHRLGASCDWPRERFTMDEGLSQAVLTVFVELYRQGLIYKDNRLVNWDPKLGTAISDLEVQQREVNGKLWHIRYPLEDAPDRFITVATTRPETMLGDTGVAVHPQDERYQALVGKHCILPLVGRRLPIIADDYVDREQGSGALKVTPAHDFNDFEIGRRHGLEAISILDRRAHVNDAAPEAYRGLDRFVARDRIVADLEALELVEQIDDMVHVVPYGDRGGAPIEPYLTEQWYVDAKTLAQPAIEAVEDGRTRFVPEQWAKTYFEWMRNIQPWCISRQLWWGHQIPAWYGPDGKIFVAMSEATAAASATAHYGKPVELRRDEDVLDTWFSSALWPFSTLGWPQQTPELGRYYPTDVLVTGFDIIFFWVARMMMMGLRFMNEVPFHTVYIHALVRDMRGQKMSKSKGNIIDPLDLIDQYGADALRFTLAAMAAQGRDIKLSTQRVEGYRNFATKLWNAARFAEINECAYDAAFDPGSARLAVNRWVIGAAHEATAAVADNLDAYKFDQAAGAIYQFTWHGFCDWYLEFAKPVLQGSGIAARTETRATVAWVLALILHLLHPFMPFVTEELWENLAGEQATPLVIGEWPPADKAAIDAAAKAEMEWVIDLISSIRTVRAERDLPPRTEISLGHIVDQKCEDRLSMHEANIRRMARIKTLSKIDASSTGGSISIVVEGGTIRIFPVEQAVAVVEIRKKINAAIAKEEKEIEKWAAKLNNPEFLRKAPPNVVEEQRSRLAGAEATRAKLRAELAHSGDE